MLEWLNNNSQLFNVFINAGMLGVWLLYAQLLLSSYRRQRRPRVLINQTKGSDANAEILVSNMSEQAIFILGLLILVEVDGQESVRAITDVETREEEGHPRRVTSQGPLHSGGYMRLGSFRQIEKWVNLDKDIGRNWQSLEVRLIFLYGSADHPIGVRRRFTVARSTGGAQIIPESMDAERLVSRRQRKQVRQWLRDCY